MHKLSVVTQLITVQYLVHAPSCVDPEMVVRTRGDHPAYPGSLMETSRECQYLVTAAEVTIEHSS